MYSEIPAMQIPVLIVGGGPAGLSSSILLSRLGIPSLLVERNVGTSTHPRATGINTRSMEIFRQWGLEDRIREHALDLRPINSVRLTVTGEEIECRPLGYPEREEALAVSPTYPAVCAQDVLEPILVDHARSFAGAELRFGTELVLLKQDADGADATLVDRATGRASYVRAHFVIAADGASSRIRRELGIAMLGAERLGEYLSLLCRADLGPEVRSRPYAFYSLQHPELPGVFVPTSRDGRWVLATPWKPEYERIGRGSADAAQLVRRATGIADLAVDMLDVRRVGIGAQVAERFRSGNVFLVGDAAHRTTPSGGTGMNTGIQSAHNLAWKLAAVLSGWATPGLLDSYDAERRPVAERAVARSRGERDGLTGVPLDLGMTYADALGAGTAAPWRTEITPAGVGARAPHLWIERAGRTYSTLDLFDRRVVLLAGPQARAWRMAAIDAAYMLSVPLDAHTLGASTHVPDPDVAWRSAFGIEPDGAVLVRPDGHIAWQSPANATDRVTVMRDALVRLTHRGSWSECVLRAQAERAA
jgi:2-polyprenyl-6-methoxyphenol hydroxylase-like FAD-dependent oxidoreductase